MFIVDREVSGPTPPTRRPTHAVKSISVGQAFVTHTDVGAMADEGERPSVKGSGYLVMRSATLRSLTGGELKDE